MNSRSSLSSYISIRTRSKIPRVVVKQTLMSTEEIGTIQCGVSICESTIKKKTLTGTELASKLGDRNLPVTIFPHVDTDRNMRKSSLINRIYAYSLKPPLPIFSPFVIYSGLISLSVSPRLSRSSSMSSESLSRAFRDRGGVAGTGDKWISSASRKSTGVAGGGMSRKLRRRAGFLVAGAWKPRSVPAEEGSVGEEGI